MKTKLLTIMLTVFTFNSYCQEQCGTMKNLKMQLKKDPALKERMLQIEKQNQEWIEKNGLGFKKNTKLEFNKNSNNISKSNLNTNALCVYNNTFSATIAAPTTINAIISPAPNCTYGGEFITVTNMVAGSTYRISTLGVNNFDTQITIYEAGGGNAVAFNDDWQTALQSEIYFTPLFNGNYDVLINEFGCVSNQLCASLEVELWNIPRPVITIPVVIHVYHNGESIGVGANISDAQIQSQIDVLNEDFRRLNEDILTTPAAFRGVSDDSLIQFCLAQQKPDGTPTNGIMRYLEPTQAVYDQAQVPLELQCLNMMTVEQIIKPQTIWNRDKYLNIWVSDMRQLPQSIDNDENGCAFASTTLGYAQFPGLISTTDNPNPELTDGVWLRTNVFGKIGNNLQANYNLGRTATHEVGHWLNLKHIWGDENACAADDEVIDTPSQSVQNYGCQTFPWIDTCSPSYPGVMFMNYMDYSNDNCLSLFTYGQVARMDAALFNQRSGLLNSQGCVPSTLGSNQFENIKLLIHPNPTNSKVYFDNSKENFKNVVIYNYLGQEVTKNTFNGSLNNQEIDMSNLAVGLYVLKFNNGKTSHSIKIVKQ